MKGAIMTYGKREFRKVIAFPIVVLLYLILVFVTVGINLDEMIAEQYLAQGFPECFGSYSVGDYFFHYLCEFVMDSSCAVVLFGVEIFLIQRLFYLENRDGVSDFLRILPIREKDKALIKIGIGEMMNLFFALLFGIIGTITYQVLDRDFSFRNQIVPGGSTSTNGLLVIWQIALLLFVVLSAIFLILYLAQSIIHHRAVAFLVGIGVLGVPAMFAYVMNYLFSLKVNIIYACAAVFHPVPNVVMKTIFEEEYLYIDQYVVKWDWYMNAMLLWGAMCLVAGALIALAIRCRWNVKESSNRMINSDRVRSFIISGVSLSVAMCIGTMIACVWTTSGRGVEINRMYLMATSCVSLAFYGVAQGVLYIYKRYTTKDR